MGRCQRRSLVLPHAQAREFELGLQRADLPRGRLELFLQLPCPGRCVDEAGAGLRELGLVGSELRLGGVELVLVLGRVDAKQQFLFSLNSILPVNNPPAGARQCPVLSAEIIACLAPFCFLTAG